MLFAQLLHLGFDLHLHLFPAGFHMQNGLDAGQIHPQVAHQPANVYHTLDIAIRVEARTVRTAALAGRGDQAQALVVAQGLLMHLGPLRRDADHIPCSLAYFGHHTPPSGLNYDACASALRPRLRASCWNRPRSSLVRCIGRTTLTRAYSVPLPSPRRRGMPLPLRRKVRPFCVSGGMVRTSLRPSGRGTGTSPPSIAVSRSTSISIYRSSPLRSNCGSGFTLMTR